jgi:nucleotide-binding universal stress UspA family protein
VAPSTGAAVPAGFMERSARPSEAVVVRGDPAAELVRLAREHDAAFIVVGTRGRGLLSGIMLGRVCSALVRGRTARADHAPRREAVARRPHRLRRGRRSPG